MSSNKKSIKHKVKEVLKASFDVKCKNIMKVNFLSASVGVLPYKFAKKQARPNQRLLSELKKRKRSRRHVCLGITIMDFPGHELIGQIVKTNKIK